MVVPPRDDAVSEVIGFILILAIIAIVASLYLTYVVPSQGRDLEIVHMATIQNEFLGYKTSIDSLWINQQNVTIINPFILGTNPGSSQGSFLNLPLFQPLPSSGTMSVNGPNGGTTLQVDATQYKGGVSPDQGNSDYTSQVIGTDIANNITITTPPNHIYVIVNTTGQTRYTNPVNIPSKSIISTWNSTKNSWSVTISAIPKVDYTNLGRNVTTDIIVNSSVQKLIGNQMYSVSRELPVKTDADPNTAYTVDLIDIINQAYNIDENITYPQVINSQSQGSSDLISSAIIRVEYSYGPGVPLATIVPVHQVGSLEYQSQNNYWIQQNYIYQMGGVYVIQSDGAGTKIPPAISISRSPVDPSVALVQVTDFTINGNSTVSSTGLVHADTSSQVSDGREIPQYANAASVTITINNEKNPGLTPAWNVAMDRVSLIAQNAGGVPGSWIQVQYGTSPNYQTTIQVHGQNVGQNDVTLVYTPVNLNVYVEPEASGS